MVAGCSFIARADQKLRDRSRAVRCARGSILLGLAIFGLLWILHIPLREIYVPNEDDISQFAGSILLAPKAHWQNWFTRGYAHDFDLYPDWPAQGTELARTAYTRPAFQFVIYLAHFVLGRDWASYQLINCLAIAGMSGVAFQIAQTALGLRAGPSLVAAILVVLSPPLWLPLVSGVGYAIEPLATVLVAGAFLSVLARRDLLCIVLLLVAVMTKENALWAPLATAITIMLRPKRDESLHRRVFIASAMLLPVAMWLGLRFAFFDGVGGTFATAGYTSLGHFLILFFHKLSHMHYLFITHTAPLGGWSNRGTTLLILDRGAALLIYTLLFLWALRLLPEAFDHLRYGIQQMQWPIVDGVFLVSLWAAIALAFHFALPLNQDRYETSVVVFAWPALVAETERRDKAIIRFGLAVLCAMSFTRTSYLIFEKISAPVKNNVRFMDAVVRGAPLGTRRIYVISAGGLQEANPEYVRPILGVSGEIVRVAEIDWGCRDSELAAFNYSIADGVVSLTVTLPSCANFYLYTPRFNSNLINGRLYRSDALVYELPEADANRSQRTLLLGRRITVHVHPNGPARFVIEHGGTNGIAWFDTR